MPPIEINKGKGILRLLLNPEGFARSIFQENRKGGVFSLCVIRLGLENLLKAITIKLKSKNIFSRPVIKLDQHLPKNCSGRPQIE